MTKERDDMDNLGDVDGFTWASCGGHMGVVWKYLVDATRVYFVRIF